MTSSAAFLLLAAPLWYGSGYQTARECLDHSHSIPKAAASEMTPGDGRVEVAGEWSEPLPSRNDNAVLALAAAGLATIPPYVVILRQRRQG